MFVGEPSVEDTISILRGIKDKYELHHGVKITDGAIVAAATLSNRYITDRFLPDKAIDLIDEAASRLRMVVDSKPEALDELDRRLMQLKIEREALKRESDAASRERLDRLETEIAELAERSDAMTAAWKAEKDRVTETQKLKEQLDQARSEVEIATRRGDYARAGELTYGRIPEIERKIAESGDGGQLVNEAVTEDQIAAVVARWTGHPDGADARRRAGQAGAHGGRAARSRGGAGGCAAARVGCGPARASRVAGPEPADWQFSCSSAPRASARPS